MDQNINKRERRQSFMRPCSVSGEFASPETGSASQAITTKPIDPSEHIFSDEDITIEGIRQQIKLVQKGTSKLHYYLDDIDKLKK